MEYCAVAGCKKPRRARGWCCKHYERWRRYGDPLKLTPMTTSRRMALSEAGKRGSAKSKGEHHKQNLWKNRGHEREDRLERLLAAARDEVIPPKLWLRLVKAQADHKCEWCSTEVHLAVHHIDGNKRNNRLSNGACLCFSCHQALHQELRKSERGV